MKPYISIFSNEDWPIKAAMVLQDAILSILRVQDECSVMLTGGKTAAKLYKAWAPVFESQKISKVNFYFGDERFVPHSDIQSNFNMVMSTLFLTGFPEGCSINPIQIEGLVAEGAALLYEKILPNKVDILILTPGEDGHIASLFPKSAALKEFHRKVIHVLGPRAPINRITITPKTINNANKIFLLVTGSVKGSVLGRILSSHNDANLIPAVLARRGVWLLDQDAANNL